MSKKSYILITILLATVLLPSFVFILWHEYRPKPLLCGIRNGMGICYLNSVMQALFSSEKFNELLTKYSTSENEMIQSLIEIRALMREGGIVNLLPVYKKMFNKADQGFNLSHKGGSPIFALEYIGKYMEKTIANDFFLAQENYEKTKEIQNDLSLCHRFLRFYPLLKGNVNEMLKNGLEKAIDKKSFRFPELLVVCLWNVHSYTDASHDRVVCNPEITVFGKKYRLVGLVVSVKSKKLRRRHAFAIGLRADKWYIFNDESIEMVKDKKCVFNNKFCSIALYDRV